MTHVEKSVFFGAPLGLTVGAVLGTVFNISGGMKYLLPFIGGGLGFVIAGQMNPDDELPQPELSKAATASTVRNF